MVTLKRGGDVVTTTRLGVIHSSFPHHGRRHGHQGWITTCLVVMLYTFVVLVQGVIESTSTSFEAFSTHSNVSGEVGERVYRGAGSLHKNDAVVTNGAIVFLAPQRHEGSMWGIDRFCMLLRAVRSVDIQLNAQFGPYPIYILVAKDHELDPRKKDGAYSDVDRGLIRHWAPHSAITFIEIDMYSGDALEPGTHREEILEWRRDGKDGAIAGRDLGYTSMCRLWSGRLQSMSFLDPHKYYLRMDDDSLFLQPLPFDPFRQMEEQDLLYAYRRKAYDHWGIEQLWEVTKPYLELDTNLTILPFVIQSPQGQFIYNGVQPYNNFHVSRIDFWRSHKWQQVVEDYDKHHLFFKYRVGDANVHAMALMMMMRERYAIWPDFPYVHNSNDYGSGWGAKAWSDECRLGYNEFTKAYAQ